MTAETEPSAPAEKAPRTWTSAGLSVLSTCGVFAVIIVIMLPSTVCGAAFGVMRASFSYGEYAGRKWLLRWAGKDSEIQRLEDAQKGLAFLNQIIK